MFFFFNYYLFLFFYFLISPEKSSNQKHQQDEANVWRRLHDHDPILLEGLNRLGNPLGNASWSVLDHVGSKVIPLRLEWRNDFQFFSHLFPAPFLREPWWLRGSPVRRLLDVPKQEAENENRRELGLLPNVVCHSKKLVLFKDRGKS